MLKPWNYTALVGMALLVSAPFLLDSPAQESKSPAATASEPEPSARPDFNDPAFNRYVDLLLLGHAWDTQDPVLLTDCALQLAEGERILMRNHKAIASIEVIELATKVAAARQDNATLDRLARMLTATNNAAAIEKVNTARKLASASRKSEPALSVSVTESNPDQLFIYQEALNGAKAATASGDATYFTNLESALADKECILVRLSSTQKAYLSKLISETKPLLMKSSNPGLSDTLLKLKEASRESVYRPSTGYGGNLGGVSGFGQTSGPYGTNAYGGQPQYQQPQYQPQYQQPQYQQPQYQQQYQPQYQQPQYQYQYQQQYQPQGYGQGYQMQYYYQQQSSRPSCYSPSNFGGHGWCGNR